MRDTGDARRDGLRFRFALRLVIFIAALGAGSQTFAASPKSLYDRAIKLIEESRAGKGDRIANSEKAEELLEKAIGMLESKVQLTQAEELLLIELSSLRYWVRKMRPMKLDIPKSKPRSKPKPEPNPPGNKPNTKSQPPAPPSASRRPPSSTAPQRRTGDSKLFRGLPVDFEPFALHVQENYRKYRGFDGTQTMREKFYRLLWHQIYILAKKPTRSLQAAALSYQAMNEYNRYFFGTRAAIVRLLAVINYDRMRHAKRSDGYTFSELSRLRKGFRLLSVQVVNFESNYAYFKALERRSKHPDVKLGIALSLMGWVEALQTVRFRYHQWSKEREKELTKIFGSAIGKDFIRQHRRYENAAKGTFEKKREEALLAFRDYGKVAPDNMLYVMFGECVHNHMLKDTPALNRSADVAFQLFLEKREKTDADRALIRVVISLWLGRNGYKKF